MRKTAGSILIVACVAWAQSSTAKITGSLTDPSGAGIPQARVAVLNQETGVTTEGKSNESGVYLISYLNPGHYQFSAEAMGFRRYLRALTLETGQTLQLDLRLELGNSADSITVTESTPLVQSGTSSVNQTIENTAVRDLPLASGRAGALIRLSANVIMSNEETFEPTVNFAMGGGRSRASAMLIDGGNMTSNSMLTQNTEFNPPVDSVQEVKVEVNGYPAEYGRTSSGLITMTTKSGTNQFHGTAYENLRNDDFDARSFFAPRVAPRKYNVFGTTIGGPIRKDRTHFFFSYEGTRRRDGITGVLNLPTPEEARGDFSRDAGSVLDPLTGKPFPGNTIPSSRLDPVGAKLAALYPAPDVPGAASASNNYIANTVNRVRADSYLAKIDHVFSSRDHVTGRYIELPANLSNGNVGPNRAVDPSTTDQDYTLVNAMGAWFHNVGATLFNEARIVYDQRNADVPKPENFGLAKLVGLTGVPSDGTPAISVTGLTNLGQTNQVRYLKPQRTISANEGLTWFHGKHNVKMGGDYRYTLNRDTWGTLYDGQFSFNDVATGRGFALAALLLGWTQEGKTQNGDTITRSDYWGAFVQDDWKAASRLTLNLGLRWDFNTPRWETRNHQTGFDPFAINPVSGTPGTITYSGQNGLSKYAHNFEWHNLGPRIGFAWKTPAEGLVLRGGYGLMFGQIYNASLGRALSTGYGDNRDFTSPDNGLTPAFLLRDGLPAAPQEALGPGFGAVKVGNLPRISPDFLDQNYKTLYAHHFNLGVQREFFGSTLVEAQYLSNLGHHISGGSTVNINQVPLALAGAVQDQRLRPFPQYGNVLWQAPDWGNSSYHALNLKLERRFAAGVSLLFTYTYSKFLDDLEANNELGPAPASGMESYYAHHLDKSLSGNDIRSRFTGNFVYELPVGWGKRLVPLGRSLDRFFGGWSIGMISELRSGSPYGVIEQSNRLNTFSASQRSNLVGDPALPTDRPRAQLVQQWFNTAAFAFPGNGQLGNVARAVGAGPGFANFDISLLKEFKFTESRFLQFRSEFFNALNRPNFGLPNGSRGGANFGRIISTVNDGRFIQLGLRIVF